MNMAMMRLRREDPRVVGSFRLHRRLGAGGMGVVYLGSDRKGQRVALKVIRPDLAEDQEFRSRFAREVSAARRIRGGCTARLVAADLEADRPWFATQYVPGPSLHDKVADEGALGAAEVAAIGAALSEGLVAVHEAGVVHRDLKPSNILLSPKGPRIIDFGIARDERSRETALTTPGGVLGSPAYMSPEQAKSLPVTAASDVFSLGGTLYFAATGRHPFEGEGDYEVLVAVCTRDADLPEVPEPVRSAIADCLRKDPAQRPTAARLVTQLAEAVGGVGAMGAMGAADVVGAAGAIEAMRTVTGTSAVPPPRPPGPVRGGAGSGRGTRQLRLWAFAAGSAAVAVLLAVVLSTTSGGSATEGGRPQTHGSGTQLLSYTDDLTDSGDWLDKDPALAKVTHEGGTMLVDPRSELEVWPQAPFEPSSFAVRLSTQTEWYGGEGGVGLWCNGSGNYWKGSRWATYLTTDQEALIVREFRFKGKFQHDRVVEVNLADVGLKVRSQQQVDMTMTCSAAGQDRIKVELAVDGTRVASYTGAAFDARGCGVAAFHYSATDPRGTAYHAGFERFTATELATD
nr:serine/threonine-protein kinase [Streptomyces sp. MBT65]